MSWRRPHHVQNQAHCYRCGAPNPHDYGGTDWIEPLSVQLRKRFQ